MSYRELVENPPPPDLTAPLILCTVVLSLFNIFKESPSNYMFDNVYPNYILFPKRLGCIFINY